MLCSLLCSRFPDRFACVFLHRFFVIVGRERRQRRKRIYISTHTHTCDLYALVITQQPWDLIAKREMREFLPFFLCTFVFSSQNLSDVSPHAMTRPPNQTKDPPSRKCVTHISSSLL